MYMYTYIKTHISNKPIKDNSEVATFQNTIVKISKPGFKSSA